MAWSSIAWALHDGSTCLFGRDYTVIVAPAALTGFKTTCAQLKRGVRTLDSFLVR